MSNLEDPNKGHCRAILGYSEDDFERMGWINKAKDELEEIEQEEIRITLPTKMEIKQKNKLYIYIETLNGNKQFIPINIDSIKEIFVGDKKGAMSRFSKID